MDVSIIIVNYQSKKYLSTCLASVFNQATNYAFEVLLYNNDTKEDLTALKNIFPKITLINNKANLGFCQANNLGIKMAKGKYIFTLNPDVILETDYIAKLVHYLEAHKNIGAITGKIRHYDFTNNKKTNLLDSTGIKKTGLDNFYDRGQGEKDTGQYNQIEPVFGVSAAAAIYKKVALENIKNNYGYFDERFFAYKEDIDISWRLNKNGWQNYFFPAAIAYHGRGTGISPERTSWQKKIKQRQNRSETERLLSFRNQRLIILKNENWRYLILLTPYLLGKEIITLLYLIIFERFLLKTYIKLIQIIK